MKSATIFSMLFSLMLLSVNAFAATVSIPALTGDAGGTYDIPVNIDDASGVAGYQFTVTYDPSVLNCTDAMRGTLTGGFDAPTNNLSIPGKVVTLSIEPDYKELGSVSGSLALLKCTAVGGPGDATSLHFELFPGSSITDEFGDRVPAAFSDGSFTINGGSTTPHTVTPSVGEGAGHGTITPDSPQTVEHAATTTFTVTPDAGYSASVGGTCGGTLSGTTYTTGPVIADCTVRANFAPRANEHTVTPSVGEGAGHGTITPDSPQTVADEATTTFTVKPKSGYSATVSGTCGGTLSGTTYTTGPVIADCMVIANFRLSQGGIHTVTPSVGEGAGHGTITPNSAQTVTEGAMKLFTVKPAAGYWVSVVGTCGGWMNGTTYTTIPVTEDCTVKANFHTIEMISQIFPPFAPPAAPTPSETLSLSRPIGIGPLAEGGETLDFIVDTGYFPNPVDIYGAFAVSTDPDVIFIVNADGSFLDLDLQEALQALESGEAPAGVTPMISSTLGGYGTLLAGIPTEIVPPGRYSVFLLATPPGSFGAFYLWQTGFTIGVPASVPLTGAEEVPPVATSGSGTAFAAFNLDTGAISGTLSFSGLRSPATAAHMRRGAAGVKGDAVITLQGGEGAISGVWTIPEGTVLDSAQMEALVADDLYFNVQTENNPDGEIRGQIIYPDGTPPTPVP